MNKYTALYRAYTMLQRHIHNKHMNGEYVAGLQHYIPTNRKTQDFDNSLSTYDG